MSDEDLFLKELQEGFIEEALELIEQCEQSCLALEQSTSSLKEVENLFRCYHTIKGTAASVDMNDLASYTHEVENLLVKIKNDDVKIDQSIIGLLLKTTDISKAFLISSKEEGKGRLDAEDTLHMIRNMTNTTSCSDVDIAESFSNLLENTVDQSREVNERDSDYFLKAQMTNEALSLDDDSKSKGEEYIRLPLSKIDGLLDYLGEQVILQTSLNFCRENRDENKELMDKVIVQLNKITQNLQQTAIGLRMFNLKTMFKKAQRLVRDTSVQLNKKVNFISIGEGTELDKAILDELSGVITHLVRNSVDHGIEDEFDRVSVGKELYGTVELQAFQKGGYFYLVITDDGKGLDIERIKEKAIEKNLMKVNDEFDEERIYDFIFHSGFSTKEQTTDISGRGVGMDVVKKTIEKLHGSIKVKSKKGCGSSFIIKLPLTLSIFNGMIIEVMGKKIIVPNSDIVQIIKKDKDSLTHFHEDSFLRDNDSVYPIVDLANIVGISSIKEKTQKKENLFLITIYDKKKFAIKIDNIIGQQKVVLKKLPVNLSKLKGVSGATILGDGTVSLILDVNKSISIFNEEYAA